MELREDDRLCYEESMTVLTNFCKRIQNRKHVNPQIPSLEVWDYFIHKVVNNRDLAHIWNSTKNTEHIRNIIIVLFIN